MNRITSFTIGADPELFIVNTKTNTVVSSIGLIPGEKGDPWVGEDMPSGFGLEIDNILAEFNIPPVTNCHSFVNNIEYMKKYIASFVKEKNPDLDVLCAASMEVLEDQLQSPEARMFGCSVDYNVYTEGPNPKPQGERTNLRSAGFHIHCGYPNFNPRTSLKLIRYFDMYIGIPSVIWDTDTRRRELYGKAGCFRLTSYGFEYRVLSSYMMSSPVLLERVWKGIKRAISAYNNGAPLIDESYVKEVINKNNVDLAKNLVYQYSLLDSSDITWEIPGAPKQETKKVDIDIAMIDELFDLNPRITRRR